MRSNQNNKEATLQDVFDLIKETKESLEKKIDHSASEMARTTQEQFLAERKYADERFKRIDEQFKELNEKMDKGFREAKTEREDIRADINKKVDRFTHNDLVYRVEKLEKKFA